MIFREYYKGTWADGSPLLAIPNYLRMNRAEAPQEGQQGRQGDRTPGSIIWIKKSLLSD